jgi:predicted metal-dependent peptidase
MAAARKPWSVLSLTAAQTAATRAAEADERARRASINRIRGQDGCAAEEASDEMRAELIKLKEEIAGWAKQKEGSDAKLLKACAIIRELKDENAKLRIDRNLLLKEAIAALKERQKELKEAFDARMDKLRAMHAMTKMAEERREEMEGCGGDAEQDRRTPCQT